MDTKARAVAFSKTIEEVTNKSLPMIPTHIQTADFLKPETKAALAGMEMGQKPTADVEAEAPTKAVEVPTTASRDDVDDEFSFSQEVDNILNNKALREAIEARCKPILLDELISIGRSKQRVPIVPDSFEPVFQTVTGEEDLFIKGLLGKERGSDLYLSQKFSVLNLTMGLYSINGLDLPPYEKDGKLDEDLFKKRFEWVQRLPAQMLISLQVNYYWFDLRTRKLFSFR